jgi:outer membrane receptor for ferrienterochelin and colicin
MRLNLVLATLLINLSLIAFSQKVDIIGQITNESYEPISEVKVQVSGSPLFKITDTNGRYTIQVNPNDTIAFLANGFATHLVPVASLTVNKAENEIILYNAMLFPSADVFNFSLEQLLNLEVISVSKKSEKLSETPQTVIVVTRDDIQSRGYTDLEQIFHDLPGFDISRGYGTEYSQIYQRGYRSNNTDRTLFLIDGVEENDLWSGSAWIGRQFPLNNIEKIEVIYGPATTVYGPNAFVGAVNVVTKGVSGIIKPNNFIGINANTGYGTWNTLFTDLTIAARHKNVSLSVSGRWYQSDEMDLSKYPDWDYILAPYTVDYYKQLLGTASDEVATAAQSLDQQGYENSPSLQGIKPSYSNRTENYYVYGKLNIQNLTLGFETFKRKEGYGAWYTDKYELGTDHGGYWIPKNLFLYAKYREAFTNNLTISSFTTFRQHGIDGGSKELYYIGYLNGELNLADLTDINGALLPEINRQKPYWWVGYYQTYSNQLRSELKIEWDITSKLNFVMGAEYRLSHIQGQYLVSEQQNPEETGMPEELPGGNHFHSNDFGLFAQGRIQPVKHLFIIAGGRVDNNRIRKTGGYGTVFNPKLAVVYSPNKIVIKAIYSEAFKDADFWTKYGTTPGRLLNNPGLSPEKVKNIDLSFGWQFSKSAYFDIVGYSAMYDGVVGTADVTYTNGNGEIVNTTQHQPIGSLAIMGVQGNFNFRVANYSAYLNYTFTHPYNTTGTKNIRIGDIASHRLNFGTAVSINRKTNLSLRCNWVGERKTGDSTTISSNPYSKIDPYFVVNGAISHQIWNGISAQISIFNFFNTEYFHPGVRSANGTYYAARLPQYERQFVFSLRADL